MKLQKKTRSKSLERGIVEENFDQLIAKQLRYMQAVTDDARGLTKRWRYRKSYEGYLSCKKSTFTHRNALLLAKATFKLIYKGTLWLDVMRSTTFLKRKCKLKQKSIHLGKSCPDCKTLDAFSFTLEA